MSSRNKSVAAWGHRVSMSGRGRLLCARQLRPRGCEWLRAPSANHGTRLVSEKEQPSTRRVSIGGSGGRNKLDVIDSSRTTPQGLVGVRDIFLDGRTDYL